MASTVELKPSRKPILVTGAHRSGTTWVGKMLSAGGQAAYISEPLNILHRPGVLSAATSQWYTYICTDNEEDYLPAMRQMLQYRYHPLAELRSLRSLKDLGRMGRDWGTFLRGRTRQLRPLLKDPFAVFSVPWFAERLDCEVVITVRHPAAFVSSLKRLGWPFDLKDLLAQPLLVRDWLEPFRAEMERLSRAGEDSIGANSLLWRIVYQVVGQFRRDHPQIQIVRHEDLSAQPIEGFKALSAALGLDFSSRVRQAIESSSSAENPKELSRDAVHSIRLDSQANLDNWKRRLSPEEIRSVRTLTEETASAYYSDLSWD